MSGFLILSEEEKKKNNSTTKSATDCYFIWNQLKRQRGNFYLLFVNFDEICGIDEEKKKEQVTFRFVKETFSIYCQTSEENFSRVQASFNKYISEINIIKFLVDTPIDVNSYKHPASGKFLKEEYFEKY